MVGKMTSIPEITDTIIFLHGKESTPESSGSAKAIIEYFKNYTVLVPDYRPLERAYEEIENFLTGYIQNAIAKADGMVHLVGISLGGYWAYTMACKIRDVYQCILLNPSFRCYPEFPIVPPPHGLPISLIVNLDDDVLNPYDAIKRFEGRAGITTFECGGHRFNNRNEMLHEIEKPLNQVCGG
jgi:pimeloyl-ACP methyl ester carboxylesterase